MHPFPHYQLCDLGELFNLSVLQTPYKVGIVVVPPWTWKRVVRLRDGQEPDRQ